MMSDELIDTDKRSCVSTMCLKEKKKLLKPKKRVTDSKTFEEACKLAAKDPVTSVERLIRLAKRKIDGSVEFWGIKGSKRQTRVVATQLLGTVLEINLIRTTLARIVWG